MSAGKTVACGLAARGCAVPGSGPGAKHPNNHAKCISVDQCVEAQLPDNVMLPDFGLFIRKNE